MKHFALAILTYIAAVLQAAAIFRLSDDTPAMLFLPIVFALALLICEGWQAIVWGAVIGLVSDALNAGPLGVHMLSAVLIAALSGHLKRDRKRHSSFRRAMWGIACCFLFLLTTAALDVTVAKQTVAAGPLLSYVLIQTGQCVIVALIGVFLWNGVAAFFPAMLRPRSRPL